MQQILSVHRIVRTGLRSRIVLIMGCLFLAGCVAVHNEGSLAQVPDPVKWKTGADNATPIEALEENYPDGTLKKRVEGLRDADGNFINHGLLTNYWENGRKKSQETYVNGIRHGPRTAWYRDGRMWSYGDYVDGKAHGTWTQWLPTGAKGHEMHFDHGAVQGLLTEWYPNGQRKKQVMYVHGQRQGADTMWNQHGQVLRRIDYVDDIEQPTPY